MNKVLGLILAAVIIMPLAAQAEDGIAKTYLRWGEINSLATSIADRLSNEGYDMTEARQMILQLNYLRGQLDLNLSRTQLAGVIQEYRDTLWMLRDEYRGFNREDSDLRSN